MRCSQSCSPAHSSRLYVCVYVSEPMKMLGSTTVENRVKMNSERIVSACTSECVIRPFHVAKTNRPVISKRQTNKRTAQDGWQQRGQRNQHNRRQVLSM